MNIVSTNHAADSSTNNNSDGELAPEDTGHHITSDLTNNHVQDNISIYRESWKAILKELFFNIIPDSLTISFGYFSGLIVLLANLAFIGRHSDAKTLEAVGLGNVWINFVGINIVFGLNYGFETLASRVWGGGTQHVMGVYLKKTFIINFVIMVCCFFMLLYTKEIFVVMGQDELVSILIYKYVIVMFPGSCFLAFYDLFIMFLNSQNIFKPSMYIQIVTTILHFGFCYIFVDVLGLNILGIAYAMNVTQGLNLFGIIMYLKFFWPERRSFDWGPKICSRKILYNSWFKFLSIVVPISMSIILEYASYEINSFIAGLLENSVAAAHVALANTGSVIYCIPEGFSTAITTFVGNAVGENKKFKAQKFAILGNISGLFTLLIVMLFLVIFQSSWPSYFSQDEEVSTKIRDMLTLFAIMNILDTIQMNLSAVLKAIGKQNLTLLIYFVCLYLIANPSSYLFGITFKGDLEGIWYGTILGNFCMVVAFILILMRVNWDAEIARCKALEEQEENDMKHLENEVSSITTASEGKNIKSMFYKEFTKKEEIDNLNNFHKGH